jgi:protein-tyrosine phosphatase
MHNLRDLGGFVTTTGAVTRHGVFWRGDSPHRVTPSDLGYFATHHITTVIDLRHEHEQHVAPNPLATQSYINYIAIPLFQVSHNTSNVITRLDDFYIHLLETSRAPIQQTFMQLAEAPGGTFFHCRVGKDRTGIIAALLLDMVEVPHHHIIADYVATAEHITPLLPELRRDRPAQIDEATYEQIIGVQSDTMGNVLDYVKKTYGSTVNYLTQIGVPAAQLTQITHKFI